MAREAEFSKETKRAAFNPRRLTHGMSKTPEYKAWQNMVARCECKTSTGFHHYGGRGISVCKEWRDSFETFLDHVGKRPGSMYSLDRFPNTNGNYEPGNVRWATKLEQQRNLRNNFLVTLHGKEIPLSQAAAEVGMRPNSLLTRIIRGWPIERALSEPIQKRVMRS